ncbi:peroxisomal targeting signal 1 receptor [Episyrphus balteatus]|uniref:peroxisomal targeting signal 1 receptor n=1 Tax=Episyrphus balteatus TaxID=286459 RepID=UPI002485C12E|nr:peroxisomal targeting signal 1 receptor [Episyrphus balteatus]
MSLRKLVEGDCGGVNPLMQLGGQFTRDTAHKDEGFSGNHAQPFESRSIMPEEQMVNEFMGQISGPPQTFEVTALLQEMREIESQRFLPQVINAPRVIDEVTRNSSEWAKEFGQETLASQEGEPMHFDETWRQPNIINVQPVQDNVTNVREFFDLNDNQINMPQPLPAPYLAICPAYIPPATASFGDNELGAVGGQTTSSTMEDWLNDFQTSKEKHEKATDDYNSKFLQRLQEEWQKLSDDNGAEHPWLSDYTDMYDPYKEYTYVEDNPMAEVENAFEKGKEFLARGDIPSAVLCFEAASVQQPQNAEVWELLGICQAENEMDPQSIAALKRSLALRPNNMRVLMALAVSYTNESLQSQALKSLTTWLHCHPKYSHLVPEHLLGPASNSLTSSLMRGPELKEIQHIFLEAVKQNPNEIDAEVQEALGVLFNLSSEFDKAVDCFQAALHVRPQNAKIWNRLGASLANGNRSVEAVEAYQRALEIEPGFIRVRYNVGVCCMNLKAYKQAAEHLLTALNLQASSAVRSELKEGAALSSSSSQMSDTIWTTFKMIISLMGRTDLHEHVNHRNLDALNEAFKDSP